MNRFREVLTRRVFSRLVCSFLAASFLVGCGASPSSLTTLNLIAIDVSESSKDQFEVFAGSIRNDMMSLRSDDEVFLFRFDSKPAEFFSGHPPESLEEATKTVLKVREHSSETEGTNLYLLLNAFEGTIERSNSPYKIMIYSDCGVEKMSADEIAMAKEIVARWSVDGRFLGMEFVGIRDGWREKIREILLLPSSQLNIR